MAPKWIALISMSFNMILACTYLYQGDYRRFIYWVSAFCITGSVTF